MELDRSQACQRDIHEHRREPWPWGLRQHDLRRVVSHDQLVSAATNNFFTTVTSMTAPSTTTAAMACLRLWWNRHRQLPTNTFGAANLLGRCGLR